MNKTVYMVEGDSGVYDTQYNWVAGAFLKKEKAEAYLAKLKAVADKINEPIFAARDSAKRLNLMSVDINHNEEARKELENLDPRAGCSEYEAIYYCLKTMEVDCEE